MRSRPMRHLQDTMGSGNWAIFPHDLIPRVETCALAWHSALKGVEKPWLCWCVDAQWCSLQQQLVLACGWTPVVCADSPDRSVELLDGAVALDFRQGFEFEGVLWMHFCLEFLFLYADRMAFWHSDLLPPIKVLKGIASQFDRIRDGETIAVPQFNTWKVNLRSLLRLRRRNLNDPESRWFELIGCTTRSASRSQFEHGCGWWRRIDCHPNVPAERALADPCFTSTG